MRIPVDTVKVVEVGPRDGLQNEKVTIPTEAKVEYITALADSGLKVIEAGAFVSPKWVPQMADTAEVYREIPKDPGVEFPVLVPNMKGLERAIEAGVKSIAIFTAASDTFNKRNINMTIDESFVNYAPVAARARAEGMRVRGYISTAFGCPYEGETYSVDNGEKSSRSKRRHRDQSMSAPMPGVVLKVLTSQGQQVTKGMPLVILEAMKMEHVIAALRDGTIAAINCKEGELVQPGFDLIELQ